jgi:hypothetical protein
VAARALLMAAGMALRMARMAAADMAMKLRKA